MEVAHGLQRPTPFLVGYLGHTGFERGLPAGRAGSGRTADGDGAAQCYINHYPNFDFDANCYPHSDFDPDANQYVDANQYADIHAQQNIYTNHLIDLYYHTDFHIYANIYCYVDIHTTARDGNTECAPDFIIYRQRDHCPGQFVGHADLERPRGYRAYRPA